MIPEPRVAGNLGGREDAIMSNHCAHTSTFGCGRLLSTEEILGWDLLTRREYLQSGWCNNCQDKIFQDPEEEDDNEVPFDYDDWMGVNVSDL